MRAGARVCAQDGKHTARAGLGAGPGWWGVRVTADQDGVLQRPANSSSFTQLFTSGITPVKGTELCSEKVARWSFVPRVTGRQSC